MRRNNRRAAKRAHPGDECCSGRAAIGNHALEDKAVTQGVRRSAGTALATDHQDSGARQLLAGEDIR